MFSTKELETIDNRYFTVIVANEYDVTLLSNNTHHVWYIHNTEYPARESCIIFHKHRVSHPYHNHGKSSSLGKAIRSIKAHDEFQMNGRKPLKIDSRKAVAP